MSHLSFFPERALDLGGPEALRSLLPLKANANRLPRPSYVHALNGSKALRPTMESLPPKSLRRPALDSHGRRGSAPGRLELVDERPGSE